MTAPLPSDGQALALEQLRELVLASSGAIGLYDGDPTVAESGYLVARISIDCTGTAHAQPGIRLRPRERFVVFIPPAFPHAVPEVWVPHHRWAGTPHVQWMAHLCLYASTSIEWVPADGILGLIDRLRVWLQRASLGELDPDDAPLHPPVAYTTSENGFVVVRTDLGALSPRVEDGGRRSLRRRGRTESSARFVVGVMEEVRAGRLDLVEWMPVDDWHRRVEDRTLAERHVGRSVFGALALLTEREITFEYPKTAQAVLDAFAPYGVSTSELLEVLGAVALDNEQLARRRGASSATTEPPELHLFLGTPSRRTSDGVLRQHLVCWRLDNNGALLSTGAALVGEGFDQTGKLASAVEGFLPHWVATANASWVSVMEDRAEITIRRDHGTAADWLAGRRLLVLGCGALGAPIAESCVRAGASALTVCDNDTVTPGILVRQPFNDADIGWPKAEALAAHLNTIFPGTMVSAIVGRAQDVALPEFGPPSYDLVIDATADASLRSVVELRRSQSDRPWPPMLTVIIGHDARRGVVTVSRMGSSGGGHDVLRKLMLISRQEYNTELGDVREDLFPLEARTDLFHPEPGCSSPTFVGSAMQLGALAGGLLNAGISELRGDTNGCAPMAAVAVRDVDPIGRLPRATRVTWENDLVARDDSSGYQVRIARSALGEMRAEVRRGARLRGEKVETGGPLFGQIDDACRCIWIDRVGGPPPDSVLSEYHFDHGIEGVDELVRYHRERSGSQTSFVGIWHSHPFHAAQPSPTDRAAMSTMVMPIADGPRRAVVLIVGGPRAVWTKWVDKEADPDISARLTSRHSNQMTNPGPPPPAPPEHRAEGWSGGWTTRRTGPRPEYRHRRSWRERLWPRR